MKTKKSYSYWQQRQDERLTYSERVSNRTISNIANIYDDSLKRVEDRIEKILTNYAKSAKMPVDVLKEKLEGHDVNDLLQKLTDDLIKNGANTNKNMKWLQGNYLKRLSNQESIKLQLENERRIIAHNEQLSSSSGYKKTIEQTYKSLTKDLTGKAVSLNESAKDSMLNKRWVAGRNYSERVWNNTKQLSEELNKVINSGLLSGAPKQEIINELSERFEVAKYRAETLVRTEMNYFENQTELKSYADMGVTHYLYLATRDNRTSEICSSIDGQRYKVSEAIPGKNYPPMHPNCRSGTIPDLEFEEKYRVFKNPITLEREKTTLDYDDWLDKVENKAEEQYNKDRDKIILDNKNRSYLVNHKMTRKHIENNFSVEEISSVLKYTGSSYHDMNEYLRGDAKNISQEVVADVKLLQKTLNKSELLHDEVLYRGIKGVTLKQLKLNELGEVSLDGFISTTTDREISKRFMGMGNHKNQVFLEIISPKGSKGMFVEEISKYSSEKEFLMPDKTKLKIYYIRKKGDYTHVKAKVVVSDE